MRHPGLIILAAGGSSRMGQPKQLLPWGSRTLLRHACETALETSCRPIVVVLGAEAARCRQECADLPVIVVENPQWTEGLGTSIAAGVAALRAEAPTTLGALLMLADQPRVTAELLEWLCVHWLPPEWPIAAVAYGPEGGVPAILHQSYFRELLCLRHDRGARGLIAREIQRAVLLDGGDALLDVDTPDAYREHCPPPIRRYGIGPEDFTD